MYGVKIALRPVLCEDVCKYIQDICMEREIDKVAKERHQTNLKRIHDELSKIVARQLKREGVCPGYWCQICVRVGGHPYACNCPCIYVMDMYM